MSCALDCLSALAHKPQQPQDEESPSLEGATPSMLWNSMYRVLRVVWWGQYPFFVKEPYNGLFDTTVKQNPLE